MRYQNYLILYIRIIQCDLFFCWKDSYKHFFLKCHNIFSTELNISATMKSKIVKVNGKRRWMHLILWRICCYHLEVIDHLFTLRNCFYFLFAIIFSSQLTVISVNAKVYFAQFQLKFAIHKRLFLKFRDFFFRRKFLPAKVSTLTVTRECHIFQKIDGNCWNWRRKFSYLLNDLVNFNKLFDRNVTLNEIEGHKKRGFTVSLENTF